MDVRTQRRPGFAADGEACPVGGTSATRRRRPEVESRTAGTHKGKASYDAVFDDAEGAGGCSLEIRFPAKKIYGLLKDAW